MALELCLRVESDKDSIFVFDQTGVFDAIDNLTGWGTPNTEIADIDRATVAVTVPDNDTPFVIDVYPTLPNVTDIGFEILPDDLGLTELTSGIYKFEFCVFDDDVQSDPIACVTNCELLTGVARCCVDKLMTAVDIDNLTHENTEKALDLQLLLIAAEKNACCGNVDKADRIIRYINAQCLCLC